MSHLPYCWIVKLLANVLRIIEYTILFLKKKIEILNILIYLTIWHGPFFSQPFAPEKPETVARL